MIQQERIKFVNEKESFLRGKCVLYWMQQSQRVESNHALEYAVFRANQLKVPVVVILVLVDDFPEANWRHYAFMLEGWREVKAALEKRGIGCLVKRGKMVTSVLSFGENEHLLPVLLVTDKGYLRVQRQWRKEVAKGTGVQMVEVESDVVVPVEEASGKEEYAARTLRPKVTRLWEEYLVEVEKERVLVRAEEIVKGMKDFDGMINLDFPVTEILNSLKIDKTVLPVERRGGYSEAVKLLNDFIENKLQRYPVDRNNPTLSGQSELSPYLHFGQISPLEIALKVKMAVKGGMVGKESAEVFLEELLVRRELSVNFCYYNQGYDVYDKAINTWPLSSLSKHLSDKREVIYSREELELAQTKDEIWNACQLQMVTTGKMHGYMRMYWVKKILEWSKTPKEAFETALYLNNKYELDGRDVNSFAGVAWCFGKHDRPWAPERKIFGLVRYMNQAGIMRKIKNWKEYLEKYGVDFSFKN